MLYAAWRLRGPSFLLSRGLWLFGALTLLLPLAWYTHTYHVSRTFPPFHMFGDQSLAFVPLDRYRAIALRSVQLHLTPIVTVAAALGLLLPRRSPLGLLFHWWLAAFLAFVIFAGVGNWQHQWYQLTLAPLGGFFAARLVVEGARQLKRFRFGRAVATVAGLAGLALLVQQSYQAAAPLYRSRFETLRLAGKAVDALTPPDALVIMADSGNGTALYYARRQGWHFINISGSDFSPTTDDERAITQLESLRGQGASYFAVPQHYFSWYNRRRDFRDHLEDNYYKLRSTREFIVFDLTRQQG
jgi:hypothetical protein